MAGRKSKYLNNVKANFNYIDKQLNNGASEKQIAKQLNINYSTWNSYKKKYDEFKDLCNKPRVDLIDNLKSKLVQRALGMKVESKKTYIKEDPKNGKTKYTEITVSELPPDTTAIFGALNIYDPEYVKDKKAYELRKDELELRKQLKDTEGWD